MGNFISVQDSLRRGYPIEWVMLRPRKKLGYVGEKHTGVSENQVIRTDVHHWRLMVICGRYVLIPTDRPNVPVTLSTFIDLKKASETLDLLCKEYYSPYEIDLKARSLKKEEYDEISGFVFSAGNYWAFDNRTVSGKILQVNESDWKVVDWRPAYETYTAKLFPVIDVPGEMLFDMDKHSFAGMPKEVLEKERAQKALSQALTKEEIKKLISLAEGEIRTAKGNLAEVEKQIAKMKRLFEEL